MNETDAAVRQGLWDGFLVSRTEPYLHVKLHRKQLKGREIQPRRLPAKYQSQLAAAREQEWTKWISHQTVALLTADEQAELATRPGANIVDLRFVATDKAETERGTQTFAEVPPEMKMRLVSKGF